MRCQFKKKIQFCWWILRINDKDNEINICKITWLSSLRLIKTQKKLWKMCPLISCCSKNFKISSKIIIVSIIAWWQTKINNNKINNNSHLILIMFPKIKILLWTKISNNIIFSNKKIKNKTKNNNAILFRLIIIIFQILKIIILFISARKNLIIS